MSVCGDLQFDQFPLKTTGPKALLKDIFWLAFLVVIPPFAEFALLNKLNTAIPNLLIKNR